MVCVVDAGMTFSAVHSSSSKHAVANEVLADHFVDVNKMVTLRGEQSAECPIVFEFKPSNCRDLNGFFAPLTKFG